MSKSIIIKAELVRETKNAYMLDCEGDIEWFPKSKVSFDEKKSELEAPVWLLREKFPNEKF